MHDEAIQECAQDWIATLPTEPRNDSEDLKEISYSITNVIARSALHDEAIQECAQEWIVASPTAPRNDSKVQWEKRFNY